jgi:mycothiol synthase
MIVIRPAETDADLEQWVHVRRVVVPNESAGSAEQLRSRAKPDRLLLLAELDGGLAGSGIAGRSDLRGRAFVMPRVLPEARRRSVGTALFGRLADHALTLGVGEASALAEDEGSQAFAERFGFREVDRQVEHVRTLGREPSPPQPPDGVELVTLAARPELLEAAYPLAAAGPRRSRHGRAGLARSRGLATGRRHAARWIVRRARRRRDHRLFGALPTRPRGRRRGRLTVVRRDWRRQGLAGILKQYEIAWAAANGYREIVTWTQRGNAGMRAVNEQLGYAYRGECLTMLAGLPLSV